MSQPITRRDLMDVSEVAAVFGVAASTVTVAMTAPDVSPRMARVLPPPIGKIGKSWVWARADVERAAAEA